MLPAALHFLLDFDGDHLHRQPPGPAFLTFCTHVAVRDGDRLGAPLFVVGLTRLGILKTDSCARTAGSVTSSSPCLAVALPGVDPVTVVPRDPPADDPLRSSPSGSPSSSTAAPPASRDRSSVRRDGGLRRLGAPGRRPAAERRVRRLGARAIVEVAPGRADRHFDGAVILPGLVNAHSHLEYAVYAGFGDGQPFGDWLGLHISRKRALAHEHMVAIARRGVADSLAAGITTTADYSFSGASALRLPSSACARSSTSRSSGRTLTTRATFEALRLRERWRAARPDRDLAARPVHLLARGLPLVPLTRHPRRHASGRERCRARVARVRNRPAARRPRAPRRADRHAPVGDARRGAWPASSSCAHCVHLDDDEIALLARHGRARRPLPALERAARLWHRAARAARAPVSASASAPTHRPRRRRSTSGRSCDRRLHEPGAGRPPGRARRPEAALRLATLDAASAIGLGDEVGSLTPGKRADLTVLSLAGSPYDPVEDPAVAAVFGGSPRASWRRSSTDTRYRQGETAWQEVRSTASSARRRMLA